jgi:very-short-patch-repair endonuclease
MRAVGVFEKPTTARKEISNYESERTRYLEQEDLKVIRFENKELYDDLEGVLETIKRALQNEPSFVSDHPVRSG